MEKQMIMTLKDKLVSEVIRAYRLRDLGNESKIDYVALDKAYGDFIYYLTRGVK